MERDSESELESIYDYEAAHAQPPAGPLLRRHPSPRSLGALVLALAVLVLGPARAGADADPASDVLLTASVFYPYSAPVARPLQQALNRETTAARRAGFPIKVALIERPLDLGGVFELFGKPGPYAKFLDTEISFHRPLPVLVVMPAGVGGYGLGAPATGSLATLPRPAGAQPGALAQAAIADVRKLAAAAGHPLGADAGVAPTGGGVPTLAIVLVAAAVVAAVLVPIAARVRGRLRR